MSRRTVVDKMKFLEALSGDPSLSAIQVRVAIKLTSLYNPDYGYAWPSIETLAREVRAGRRSIFRAIDALVERRWFERQSGGGRKLCNAYVPNFERSFAATSEKVETVSPAAPFEAALPGVTARDTPETVPSQAETVPSQAETVSPAAPNPLYNPPYKNPFTDAVYGIPPSAAPDGAVDGFCFEGSQQGEEGGTEPAAPSFNEVFDAVMASKGLAADSAPGLSRRRPGALSSDWNADKIRSLKAGLEEKQERQRERAKHRAQITSRLVAMRFTHGAITERWISMPEPVADNIADAQRDGILTDEWLLEAFNFAPPNRRPASAPQALELPEVFKLNDRRKRGELLAAVREANGIPMETLAEKLQLPLRFVADVEAGRLDWSKAQREQWQKALMNGHAPR